MCKVSDKIKFCTCSPDEIHGAKHTWSFHRYVGETGIQKLGIMIPPLRLDNETDMYNREALLKRVNEPDAFDVELNPREGDFLNLYFSDEVREGTFEYGFLFKNNSWVHHTIGVFMLEREHQFDSSGDLHNALSK